MLILYNLTMAKVTMSEGRERLSEMVEVSKNEAVIFERYGRPAAVLVSADDASVAACADCEDVGITSRTTAAPMSKAFRCAPVAEARSPNPGTAQGRDYLAGCRSPSASVSTTSRATGMEGTSG